MSVSSKPRKSSLFCPTYLPEAGSRGAGAMGVTQKAGIALGLNYARMAGFRQVTGGMREAVSSGSNRETMWTIKKI